jgi:hypothetical protein
MVEPGVQGDQPRGLKLTGMAQSRKITREKGRKGAAQDRKLAVKIFRCDADRWKT